MSLLDLEWWIYLFIVLSFFMTCLGLNYVVKKINEAKIDERFIRLLHKASTTQATQVNGPLIVMETTKGIRQNSSRSAQPSPTGISLVFNQEDNKRKQDLDETYNIIKNSIDPKRFDSLSLNSKFSQETVDLPMTKTEHYINEIVTNKIIESAHKVNTAAPKETSSLAQNNCNGTDIKTVLVKKNEYGYPSIKETTSTDRSDCYITEVMAVTKNDTGFVPAKRALPTTDYNRREIIALKDTERIIAKETTYLIQSDNNDRDKDAHNPKTKSSDKSENEAASSGPRSADDNEPSAIKKPDPNRTVAKPNVPGMKITESKIREAITKAKEEIDAINLKKKALESSLEKNTDATATNKEGSPTNKTAGSIFVKETLPKSGRVVTESSPVKLSDSGNSNAKNYSSHIHGHATEKPVKISDSSQLRPLKISDSDATKNISSHAISVPNVIANPLKPNKSGQLAAKDTSLHIKNVNSSDKLSSPKRTEHIATKITSPNTRTDQKVSREATENKTDKKEENVFSDTSPAHTQSHRHDPAIHSAVPATKSEPRHLPDQVPPNIGNVHKEAVEKPGKIKPEHITATPIASPEIGREAAKPKSMQPHSDQKERDGVTVKKDLHTTSTAPHTETHTNIAKETIKQSEHGQEAVKPTPLHPRGDHRDKQDVTGTKEFTGHALTATHSHTQTDHSVDPTKKTELQREAVKATSHGHGVKKNEDIAGKIETGHNVPAIIPAKIGEHVIAPQTIAHHPANEGLAGKKEEKRTVRRTPKDTTSSGTQTDPKITKFGKRYESDRKDIKGLSTLARSDPKPLEGVVKIEKAGPIAATETVFHPQTDHTATGIIPVTMSGRIAAKQITVNTPSNRNVTELVPIKMSIPTNKALNNEGETTTATHRSDVGNIKINEPVPITIERNVPGISAITKPNTPTHSSSIPKKTIDPNVSQSDEPQGTTENSQTGLKERLKALLSPPVLNEDVMVLKPSPSSKK
ncbi:uncharacterized protein LOC110381028 [Helicoverpa armigera]|uniref:uncharacterized protein LOC110381028 n=1 Tax=Helicoverpa armigera TaxID=29058 RepID=UPI003082E9D4